MLFQVELELEGGFTRMVTWIEDSFQHRKIKVGTVLSLKGVEGRWKVIAAYRGYFAKGQGLRQEWKVGGLR